MSGDYILKDDPAFIQRIDLVSEILLEREDCPGPATARRLARRIVVQLFELEAKDAKRHENS